MDEKGDGQENGHRHQRGEPGQGAYEHAQKQSARHPRECHDHRLGVKQDSEAAKK